MQRIITLFQRNHDGDHLVRDEVVPGAEWVLAGEGVATRMFDGTACRVWDGALYVRYELKRKRAAPPGFLPADVADPITGDVPGWMPAGDGPAFQWHKAAYADAVRGWGDWLPDGTYELIGPKIQGNPERTSCHLLIPHGRHVLADCPRTFAALRAYLASRDIDGIVWHHPDGRMVKIKKRDFGLKREVVDGRS